jgi:outer membrane protein OmpA-like peptidoglycan-associated protein
MKAIRCMLLCLVLPMFAVSQGEAQDAQGCKDSPLISRFPGSVIASCVDKDDDVAAMPMGSGKPDKKIEGEYHELNYHFPGTTAKAQVVRNVTTALRTAGYTVDYDSGAYGDFTVHMGKTWIWESIGQGRYSQIIVVEKQLEQVMVANAAALSSGLSANGHIVVNGIYFDTGKSEVKPESAAALKEVVTLLQQDAKVKVYVVGHTDNVGALAANMELSRQRAAAVVHVLTTQYGVAAARLSPFGNGPYAPVTSNDMEDGRALNRRVELVKQ